MTTSGRPAGAGASRGRTRLGVAAQVVAIIGIVACLALAAGLWIGRGWAVDQVDGIVASLDDRLARASGAAQLVSGRVGSIAAAVAETTSEAKAAAAERVRDSARVQRLVGRVSGAIDLYRELRAAYAALREDAVSALETLQQLDRLVPGLSVPDGPLDALATLDARIAEIDAAVSALASAVDGTGPAGQLAERISAAGDQTAMAVGTVTGALDNVAGRIDGLRAEIAALGDQLRSALLLGAIGATLVLLYVALLNVALWSLGRRWRREAAIPA